MNSARYLTGCKNQLHFYIFAMNTWTQKLKIQYHLESLKKREIFRYNSNKTCIDLYAENYKMLMKGVKEDVNKWWDITMFMDWKTQYSKYVDSSQTDNQVQCNSYQNSIRIFLDVERLFFFMFLVFKNF